MEGTLLAQLQDGVCHMVMEGAQHPVSQALPLSNDQALHEDIHGFLVQPLPQQTHPLQVQQNMQLEALERVGNSILT